MRPHARRPSDAGPAQSAEQTTAPKKTPVSVIVPVKNEAENLKRCLPALAWADEVFVVDSQSNDETEEVSLAHGARVVQFHFNGSYPKKKNWALDQLPLANEWVLIVDADEVVLPELAAEITRRIASDEADGYYLNARYYFLGRRIRHCGYSSCWNLRLFKHRLGRYEKMPDCTGGRTGDNEAHEHVELAGRALSLAGALEHHAYPTIATWVEKHNRYAIWEAALAERFLNEPVPRTIGGVQRFKRRLKKIAWRLPMRPLVRFVYAYFLRLGFLDGKPGLIFCSLLAFYDFLASANRYEQRITKPDPKSEMPAVAPAGGERLEQMIG
jgi:glycosyltransferase involved in cell wall biosynthesis